MKTDFKAAAVIAAFTIAGIAAFAIALSVAITLTTLELRVSTIESDMSNQRDQRGLGETNQDLALSIQCIEATKKVVANAPNIFDQFDNEPVSNAPNVYAQFYEK